MLQIMLILSPSEERRFTLWPRCSTEHLPVSSTDVTKCQSGTFYQKNLSRILLSVSAPARTQRSVFSVFTVLLVQSDVKGLEEVSGEM